MYIVTFLVDVRGGSFDKVMGIYPTINDARKAIIKDIFNFSPDDYVERLTPLKGELTFLDFKELVEDSEDYFQDGLINRYNIYKIDQKITHLLDFSEDEKNIFEKEMEHIKKIYKEHLKYKLQQKKYEYENLKKELREEI